MVAAVVGLAALFFLACLRSSATAVLLASHALAPLWTADRHVPLSCADCSHVLWLMLKAFSEALRVRWNASALHLGSASHAEARQAAVSLGVCHQTCELRVLPSEAGTASGRCRCLAGQHGWGPQCQGSCHATLCQEVSWGRWCGSGSASWRDADRPSMFHSHIAVWSEQRPGTPWSLSLWWSLSFSKRSCVICRRRRSL